MESRTETRADESVTSTVTNWVRLTEVRATVRLASPIALAQAASIAVPAVDALAMGGFGPAALAGGGLAAGVLSTVLLLAGGVLAAASPLVAGAKARGDDDAQRDLVTAASMLALLFGALIALVLASSSTSILLRLGAPFEAAEAGSAYLRVASSSAVPALVAGAMRQAHNASGRARRVAVASVLLLAAKAVFNVVVVFWVPRLGMAGLGAGTIVGQGIAVAILVAWLPTPRWRVPRLDVLRAILRLGAPIGVMTALEVGLFAASAIPVARFGVGPLAAHEVALQSLYLGFVVPLAIAQATSIRVAAGAAVKDFASVRAAARGGIATASAAALIWALALVVAAPSIGSAVQGAAPLVLTIRLVRLAAIVHVFDALQAVLGFALRGVSDTRVPAAITALAYGIIGPGVVVGLVVVGGLGPEGVWMGLVACLSATVLGFGMRWRRVVSTRAGAAGPVA